MNRTEILEQLRELMKTAMPDAAERIDGLEEDANLQTDVGLTSVGLLYVVIAMETAFDISFDGVSFADFATVKDIVDYIENEQ